MVVQVYFGLVTLMKPGIEESSEMARGVRCSPEIEPIRVCASGVFFRLDEREPTKKKK